MVLNAVEFIRRFLQHVLPSGFVRIRHYGLLAHRHRQENLIRCRTLLSVPQPAEVVGAETPAEAEAPARSSEECPERCPVCGQGRMVILEVRQPDKRVAPKDVRHQDLPDAEPPRDSPRRDTS